MITSRYNQPYQGYINYFYIKKSNIDDTNTKYYIFYVEIKEQEIDSCNTDYHYIFKEFSIDEHFKSVEQLNNYISDNYSGAVFLCKQDNNICLYDNSTYGLHPTSYIDFGDHDNINNLFIFYDDLKLTAITLEDALKEILFIKFIKE